MKSQRKRGRPMTYAADDRMRFADLIRQFGARGAREKAGNCVSVETLLKIAREFGIELKKGRRPAVGQYPTSDIPVSEAIPDTCPHNPNNPKGLC